MNGNANVANGGSVNNAGPLDPRQFGATLGNTATDLQQLRNQLAPLGNNPNLGPGVREALDSVNQAIRAAQDGQNGFRGDMSQIEKLTQQVLNPLREAEVELARSLQTLIEKDKIRAAIEDEMPAGKSGEVKAYFEAIGKGK